MEVLLPILITVGIALSIPLAMKFWRRPEVAAVEARIGQLRQLPGEAAIDRVSALANQGRINTKPVDADQAARTIARRFGALTGSFAERFSEVSGRDFLFQVPSETERLDRKYYVVGLSNDEHTRYLLTEGSDEVSVWDTEDARVDRLMSFPSIWHAVLFEAESAPSR